VVVSPGPSRTPYQSGHVIWRGLDHLCRPPAIGLWTQPCNLDAIYMRMSLYRQLDYPNRSPKAALLVVCWVLRTITKRGCKCGVQHGRDALYSFKLVYRAAGTNDRWAINIRYPPSGLVEDQAIHRSSSFKRKLHKVFDGICVSSLCRSPDTVSCVLGEVFERKACIN